MPRYSTGATSSGLAGKDRGIRHGEKRGVLSISLLSTCINSRCIWPGSKSCTVRPLTSTVYSNSCKKGRVKTRTELQSVLLWARRGYKSPTTFSLGSRAGTKIYLTSIVCSYRCKKNRAHTRCEFQSVVWQAGREEKS